MSKTERLILIGVGALGVLALGAVVAVAINLLGTLGKTAGSPPPPAVDPVVSKPADGSAPPATVPVKKVPASSVVDRPKRPHKPATREDDPVGEGEGSVVGRVIDAASHGIAGASVELRRGRNFFGEEGETKGAKFETTTGADGTYRFTGIEVADAYAVIARRTGSASARQRGVAVHAGEETRVPDVVLVKGGAVLGIVTDRNGAPLRDAKVVADNSPFAGMDVWSATADTTMTDADGHYRIEHLAPGKIKVYAAARGFAPDSKMDIDVADERETADINFQLEPALTITGTVTDTSSAPVEGAKVYATATDFRDVSRSSSLTDAAGKYLLDGLSTGLFYVFVDKDGFTRPDKKTVKAGAEQVDFQLEPNGSISGHVVDRVTGAPVAKFAIRYGRARDAAVLGLGYRNEFDSAAGEFTVHDLDAGSYVLEVLSDGYAPKRTEPIDVKVQGHVEGIQIAIDHGGSIHGVVRRASDRAPVAGATLTTKRAREQNGTYFAEIGGRPGRDRGGVTSDASGSFVVTNVGAGTYIIEVSHPDYAPGKLEGIEVAEGGNVEIGEVLVYRGGAVAGIVHDKDGQPDPNAQVSISGKNFEKKVRTNGEGKFDVRGVPPGDYTVSVIVRGGQVDFEGFLTADEGGQKIAVVDGQTVNLNL
ncbi:MAG: carboxypeptidase regulatory-like domain-containing protein [Planctomycetes bacterium]|nr:carboxypeptidase regulatory-like domain-containing protein [Planctomycetota bacterium]